MKQIVFALVLILLSAGPLHAQREGHGDQDMRKAMKELNLTDEQKDAMKEIRSATQKEMIDLRADMQKKRIDLKEIHSADAPDRPAFERLTRGIADLQVKQKLLLFDSREKVMAKLTAEQKEKFKELKEHRPMMQGKGMKGNMRGNSHRDRDSR